MIATGRHPTRREVYHAAHFLYELVHAFGVGESNRISLSNWQGRFARRKRHDAARRQWERLKWTYRAIGAPVRRLEEGRDVYLVLEPGAREFALKTLNGLKEYVFRKGEGAMVAKSTFAEIRLTDIELPEGWVPEDGPLLRDMMESIQTCPIGLINPVILVGQVPPFQLGVGRRRYAACKALGMKRILARIVTSWDPIIALDENYVREHYGSEEHENQRQIRIARVAELRAARNSNVQIARILGIDEATVRRCSGSAGADPEHSTVVGHDKKSYPAVRPYPEVLEERRRLVQELRSTLDEKGKPLSIRKIAAKLNVSSGTVSEDLQALAAPRIAADPAATAKKEWHEIDPVVAEPRVCLAAMEAGIAQLNAELRAGTATLARGRQVQRLCLAIAGRIRRGEFKYQASSRLKIVAS